jgi:hypothetical protein
MQVSSCRWSSLRTPTVQTSVLGIISDGDLRYVGADQMELSAQLAPAGRLRSACIANASRRPRTRCCSSSSPRRDARKVSNPAAPRSMGGE